MGISTIISGAIVFAALVFVIFNLSITMDNVLLIENTSTELFNLEDSISKTELSIESITASAGLDTFTLNLKNTGTEKLWNYEEFDLFVTYDADIGGIKNRVTEHVVFGDTSDFVVQNGCTTIPTSASSKTLFADSDYTATEGEAFVRIVNTRLSGNGNDSGGGTLVPDDFTAYISDASDLTNQIVFSRETAPAGENTVICYEIIDYQGPPGGGNAIRVHDRNTITYGSGLTIANGAVVNPAPTDDNDVVVFITGQAGDEDTQFDWNEALSTSSWDGFAEQPVLTRGLATGSEDTNDVSYAVIEFTGANWIVQRIEHQYSGTGVESEFAPADFTAVNDISRTFLHTQHRVTGATQYNLDEAGEEAWLVDVDQINFDLENSASGPFGNYFTVVWIIENTQVSGVPMKAQHISGTRLLNTGGEPDTWTETIPTSVLSTTNAVIMGENAGSTGTGNAYPRGAIALEITAVDTVTLTRSDNGQTQNYRFSVVEFPKEEIITQWNIVSFVNDIWDPGILNTDEVAQISVQLGNQIFANGEVIVVISSENGIITSKGITST